MVRNRTRWVTLTLSLVLSLFTFKAATEDIDIFSVDQENIVDKPNVLIVLDNSANWSRQSQQWPEVDGDGGSLTQGQSEVRAIKNVINGLDDNSVNLGLLLYSTAGSANINDGGYVRFHIRPMDSTNKATLSGHLDTMFNNINDPVEKRSQGNPFGDLFWDVYNYLSGGTQSKGGAGTPSSRADALAYLTQYSQFRSPLTSLDGCRRNIIIFIGNNVSSGPTGDSDANVDALDDAGGETDQIPFANYTVESVAATDDLGYSTACYDSVEACTSAENGTACTDDGYDSCSCSSTNSISCTAQQTSKFTVYGVNSSETLTTDSNTSQSVTVNLGSTLSCKTSGQMGNETVTCPAGGTSVSQSGSTRTTVTTSYANCAYVNINTTGCGSSKANYEPQGTKTTQTLVQTVSTTTTRTSLGETAACYVDAPSCSTTGFNCAPYSAGCVCDTPSSTAGCTPAGSGSKFKVVGNYTQTEAQVAAGLRTPPTQGGSNFMVDEWARFLRNVGVPLPNSSDDVRAQVTTYTLDVFNAQQNADFSALLFNTAQAGGGKYYQAKNEDQIEKALGEIFAEIQAVNTAFASASLPVSATNRAQNENQVFIGLFRPDRQTLPVWFGNLKRYEVILAGGTELLLGDKNGNPAINNLTGFLSECATSFWTTDSGEYWLGVGTDVPPAVSLCTTSGNSVHSDSPDGPFVEKGAVAQILREGNPADPVNAPATPDGNGNYTVNRTVYTRSSSALVPFDATNAATVDELVRNFIRGQDVRNDDGDDNTTEPRSTIHGDVVHSRPQPINYGSGRVVVYYGSNDGTYRAVEASTGRELWAFVAPEHFGKLARLKENSPNILYPGGSGGSAKDYFFDGSTGLLQSADNTRVWIFPTMRRGGRKVYAFNVTNPDSPVYKWSKGCDDGGSCDTGFSDMGQTWSQPSPAFIANYDKVATSGADPVVIFGGGYDGCEDTDEADREPTGDLDCDNEKGSGVYVVDADDGSLLKHFDFTRSVVGDVALIDTDFDGNVDYGYAVDTGGSVHRISFLGANKDEWTAEKIASTEGDGRKFLFAPALLQAKDENGNVVVYIAVGSGDREHPLRTDYPYLDESPDMVNRFYVFKDAPTGDLDELDLDDENEMFDQTTPVVGVDSDLSCSEDTERVLPESTVTKRGWYFDLTDYGRGEQVVTSAVIAAGSVFFSTNRADPPVDAESLACTSNLGEARGYSVNLLTGAGTLGDDGLCGVRSAEFVGGGLPPSPVIATVPIDGGGVETVCIGCAGRDSPLDTKRVDTDIPSIRRPIYWYTQGDTE